MSAGGRGSRDASGRPARGRRGDGSEARDAAELEREVRRIGERVRAWRDAGGLTLQDLAGRSGVATSTIQKIETGQMIPSVAVLLKVARGLGRRPSELVSDAPDALELVVVRAAERHPIGLRGRLLVERLSGDLPEPALETWRVTLYPGQSMGEDAIRYPGEELVVCDEGEVTFRVGESEYVLRAGDVLHFKADVPHGWRNDGRRVARFTVTGTLPGPFRAALSSRLRSR